MGKSQIKSHCQIPNPVDKRV